MLPQHRAERIALAILCDRIPADRIEAALEDLRLANRETDLRRREAALSDYRRGGPVWAWPATAPYAGWAPTTTPDGE